MTFISRTGRFMHERRPVALAGNDIKHSENTSVAPRECLAKQLMVKTWMDVWNMYHTCFKYISRMHDMLHTTTERQKHRSALETYFPIHWRLSVRLFFFFWSRYMRLLWSMNQRQFVRSAVGGWTGWCDGVQFSVTALLDAHGWLGRPSVSLQPSASQLVMCSGCKTDQCRSVSANMLDATYAVL